MAPAGRSTRRFWTVRSMRCLISTNTSSDPWYRRKRSLRRYFSPSIFSQKKVSSGESQ
jgi:hypothetical protein